MKHKPSFDADIYGRAQKAIAHSALTNSKRPESFVRGIYPTHLFRGQGCHVWDTKGNKYIDHIAALGANLLGYGQEEVAEAIARQAKEGCVLSLGSVLEVEVAEQLKGIFPFMDRLRFLKTGSEATTAACIIARAHTGRKMILSDGYHSWHPEFTSLTPPAHGICDHQFIGKLEQHYVDETVAAVIVEPVITDVSEKRIDYLRQLRRSCDASGVLLIFDEIISGFRYPDFSVARHYGIVPDIICLGKAIANGLPLSVVGGKQSVFESEFFVSSTFAGEMVSLAAAKKVLDLLQNKFRIEQLWLKGQRFLDQFNAMGTGLIQLEGYPTRSKFVAEPLNRALFFQEACKAGVLVGPSFFYCFPHMELAEETLSIFSDIITRIKTGSCQLEGEMPVAPFAERVRA